MPEAEQGYRIKKGDTLSGIAKSFGHRNWEDVWKDGANRALVSKRKVPEAIQPGDTLIIPFTKDQLAEARREQFLLEALATSLKRQVANMRTQISSYDEIISDQQVTTDKIVAELETALKGIRKWSDRVDKAAEVATMIVGMHKSIVKLSLLGQASLRSNGIRLSTIARHASDALKEAGKDKLKDDAKYRAKHAIAEHKESSDVLLSTVANAADWLIKVETPSFWANAFVKLHDGKSVIAALAAAKSSEVGDEIEERITLIKQQGAKTVEVLRGKRNMVEGQLRQAQKTLKDVDGQTK